jgi:hypothetical protein
MRYLFGFGDVVHPGSEEKDYPTILNLPAPRLRVYPRETVVAEKFEAMVYLGTLNTRMKDFFDIWLLARQFDFVGAELARAIGKTFDNRSTELDPDPAALTAAFTASQDAQKQWAAFVRRSKLEDAPATLEGIREPLRQFLVPVAEGRAFADHWSAPGPWAGSSQRPLS